jgi:hypothetical protein
MIDLLPVSCSYNDLCPLSGEKKGDRAPQASSSTRDNGYFILQFHGRRQLSLE